MRFVKSGGTLYFHVGPVLNKALEVGGGRANWKNEGFDYRFQVRSRGDHAGLTFWIELSGFLFELNLHDTRHWNHEKGRFYLPGEEPVFEGYPHE